MNAKQEEHWTGPQGTAYHERSPGNESANYHFFAQALAEAVMPLQRQTITTSGVRTILELGAGTGANVRALEKLYPFAEITALELNEQAAKTLKERSPNVLVHAGANVVTWEPVERYWDVVITKGLLIHIRPWDLSAVYERIHRAAGRYILLAEYYNPTPVDIRYRGEPDLLWKRDFAGEMLDRFTDLRLKDYGFAYHRDDEAPQDDITWFLLERGAWTKMPPPRETP